MIDNIFVLKNYSQIRKLSTKLRYQILNELIKSPATCQQLADIFKVSKQKVHYILKDMLKEDLIRIDDVAPDNNKEKYFRAKAKNYILDFSLGTSANSHSFYNRELLHSILDNEHNISLTEIAANLLDNSLKMKPKESLLINTGEYNMPLVKRIMVEAAKRQIAVTVKYQDRSMVEEKYNHLSLSALSRDYENFNRLLKQHDVYLNLNGEARFVQPPDKHKLEIIQKAQQKSFKITLQNKIKIAIMPGLNNDALSEDAVLTELNFWRAINVDYQKLYDETENLRQQINSHAKIEIQNETYKFSFKVDKVLCEYGSFNNNPSQSPIINLPGGEILIMPVEYSLNGTIHANIGYSYGETILNPILHVKNNRIESFSADENGHLIEKAILDGGPDGGKIAFVCLGTNYNMGLEHIDLSYKSKTKGFLSIYWGDNSFMGGNVQGNHEWIAILENFKLNLK